MTTIRFRLVGLAAVATLLGACGGSGTTNTVASDVGITADGILLGNTIAKSGPAAAYGTIADAESAYFQYINDTDGGVNDGAGHKRKITFKVLDDAYTPATTKTLTKQLIEQDQVFAMFSGLGTAAQLAVRDDLNTAKVPQLFVASGATTFSADYAAHSYTLGWQPAYQGEARIYARHVLDKTPNAKIAVLYQNDDYGQDYLKGLTDGLGSKAASMIVAKESYDVTAADTKSQLATLKASGADTLFIFATPGFTIKSLAVVTALGWSPQIYLNSVSNPQVYMGIATKAGAKLDGVISVGYIKDPTDPQWAADSGMLLYQKVIKNCTKCNANDGFNIYGVAVAYTMVDVLKQAGTNLSRKNVMNIAATQLNESNPFLLPKVQVKTTSSDHFPITQENLLTYQSGAWHLTGDLIEERGTLK